MINARHLLALRVAAAALAGLAGWSAPSRAALAPASFDENVGIGSFANAGASLADAEWIDLTVLSGDFDHRGGGSGSARAGDAVPVSAEAILQLTGDVNVSGIGGSAVVETRLQFAIEALAPGLPGQVPIHIHSFGEVAVDSSLPPGPSGRTFARSTTPFGQVQVDNYDAAGTYTGAWQLQWDIAGLAQVGNAYSIILQADTHGQAFGAGYGPDYLFNGRAAIDASVAIDPGFAQAAQYRIVYSPGIMAVVPEPSPSALLALGMLGLFCGRRADWPARNADRPGAGGACRRGCAQIASSG